MHKRHLLQIAVSFFAVILMGFMGFSAWAVPGTINYQGRLTDPNGIAQEGDYEMGFSLYNTKIGGDDIWNEQQTVRIRDGIYNVQLGAVNPLSIDLFNDDTLYLEVQIGNETLYPRDTLTSTAFAMRAGVADMAIDAQTVGGIQPGDILDTSSSTQTKAGGLNISGKLGIGTDTPSGALHVNGTSILEGTLNIDTKQEGTTSLDQSQTSNQFTVFLDADWQSFTAGTDGILTRIEVLSVDAWPWGSSTTLRIYEGEGTSGASLYEGQYNIGITAPDGIVAFDIPVESGPGLSSGSQYTFQIENTDGFVWFESSNPYAGGISSFGAERDFWFKTYMRVGYNPGGVVAVTPHGNVGIGTQSPAARLHVTQGNMDTKAFIRASNFNPVPAAFWPDFDETTPYLLRNALWVGWDDNIKAWKYSKESDNDRGVTDPGDPATWEVNGESTGYFDGDLDSLPPGTHINNRYNPRMMAARCNQDDIQVKVGSFWMDKYPCRIIDVGPDYTGTTWKDDTSDMTTSANTDVPPYWMAFSQKARASTGMTWFVAAQASVNAGKRLPDNAEWQAAALGTARSSGNGIADGSDWSTVPDQDVSRYGVIGMAGNVWEWIADWIQAGRTWQSSDAQSVAPWPSGKGYGDDQTWNINGRAYNGSSYTNGAPAAPLRGGHWGYDSAAGVFSLNAYYAPSSWDGSFGFRSVR